MIAQGAEAKLYLDNNKIIKERIKKSYRISQIDSMVRKKATRAEVKILKKASDAIPVPKVFKSSDSDMIIEMEFIDGPQLKEIADCMEIPKRKKLFEEVGMQVAKIHNLGIVHGDLTTSNMILKDNKIFFIDFGLGFFTRKIEDKAVDIHLFKQALNSRHYTHCEESFSSFLDGYSKDNRQFAEIMKRFIKVEERGRYKKKSQRREKNA